MVVTPRTWAQVSRTGAMTYTVYANTANTTAATTFQFFHNYTRLGRVLKRKLLATVRVHFTGWILSCHLITEQ